MMSTVIGAMVLVILSPLAMLGMFADIDVDWPLLGNIGQTYGAVSAVLAAAALAVLGVSVALQAKEMRHAREQAARSTQFELMRMMVDDPVYREVVGWDSREGLSSDELRRDVYINLLLNWWRMRWEFKDMPEHEVRAAARGDIFFGSAGRDYWRRRGEQRLSFAKTRRERRFEEMFAEEYAAAMAAGPEEPSPARRTNGRRVGIAVALGAGAVAGMACHRLLHRSPTR
ncbi:Uncharacterised protein [Mycobacterium tuberculosis]|nr:Uncharacterised protein [Mycobacterium tuberculosis]